MKSFKIFIQTLYLLALSAIFTPSYACIDNMDSYLTVSYSMGCKMAQNTAKGIVDNDLTKRYNSSIGNMCSTFSNGVSKKELDMMFPQLAKQSAFTCTKESKENTIRNIRAIFPPS